MKVYITGHTGLVGSATSQALRAAGHETWLPQAAWHRRLDLRDEAVAIACVAEAALNNVDAIVHAAAVVGGIGANSSRPVDFLYDNIAISTNVIRSAHTCRIPRLVNLGSSCIYPRDAPQPIAEEALLTGPLEPTNAPYAIAKIAALELVRAYRRQHGCHFISLMPTNLYGPLDRYDVEASHVIPALVLKFERARILQEPVTLWGSGTPLREFLHVHDLARAIIMLLEQNYDDDLWLNVGSAEEISISELAHLVANSVGFHGRVLWDASKPDGTPRKLLDSRRIRALGWSPTIGLREGLSDTVADYRRRFSEVERNLL